MKKTKLILLAFLSTVSLAVSACNLMPQGGPRRKSSNEDSIQESYERSSYEAPSSAPASYEQPSSAQQQTSSKHTHKYGVWQAVKAPTCVEDGEERRFCTICGLEQARTIRALGHDFSILISSTGSCGQDGVTVYQCSRCGDIVERQETMTHQWEDLNWFIDSTSEEEVSYTYNNCSNCDAIKLELKALDCTFIDNASNKSGTPSPFLKLTSNNMSVRWQFNLEGTKSYYGVLYQRAMMDNFGSNTEVTYFYKNTSSEGTFSFQVNGLTVDKTQYQNLTYGEMLSEGDETYVNEGYSPIALCPIGEVILVPGLNEVVFTRIAAYNLMFSELVFVVSPFEHTHQASSEWYSDNDQHWHVCSNPGCPISNYKMDIENHVWGVIFNEVSPTCSEAGYYQQACEICGCVRTIEIPTSGHTWSEWEIMSEATCSQSGVRRHYCTVCGALETVNYPKLDHEFGEELAHYDSSDNSSYVPASLYSCVICDRTSLRWSALDYDPELTSTDIDKNSSLYVRFGTNTENSGGTYNVGSHIVYKVKIDHPVDNAGLSFYIKNTSGNGSNAPVFKDITGDSNTGYYANPDGSFTQATHRYGLRVNGVEYFLGDDDYGSQPGAKGWFEWPVSFPLDQGINTIDIFAYGTYRAQMMQFQINNLPSLDSTHTHSISPDWIADDTYHWHRCSDANCPLGDSARFEKSEHIWGNAEEVSAPTCYANGVAKRRCNICGYEQDVVIPAYGHKFMEGVGVENSEGKPVYPLVCEYGDAEGFEMNFMDCVDPSLINSGKVSNNSTLTWKFAGVRPGTVDFWACAKIGGGDYAFANGYGLQAGNSVGTVDIVGYKLSDFGATTSDYAYFRVGSVEITANDIDENGEVLISYIFPRQDYRHIYGNTVRIIYTA